MRKNTMKTLFNEYQAFCKKNACIENAFANFEAFMYVSYDKYRIEDKKEIKYLFIKFLQSTNQFVYNASTSVKSNEQVSTNDEAGSSSASISEEKPNTTATKELSTPITEEEKEINISRRKQHLKRDYIIKKFLVPTAIMMGASGAASAVITAANLVAGTGLFIPVTSNAVVNYLSTLSNCFAVTAVATPAIIAVKNIATKAYYKARYGNVKNIIKKLEKAQIKELNKKLKKCHTEEERLSVINSYSPATKYENLTKILDKKLNPLKEKVLASTAKVNALKDGKKWTAPFRAIARTAINVVNRNRIHHIMKCDRDLQEAMNIVNNSDFNLVAKKASLNSLHSARVSINDFMKKDIATSMEYLKANPHKKNILENADIYANNILTAMINRGEIKAPETAKETKEKVDELVRQLSKGEIDLLGNSYTPDTTNNEIVNNNEDENNESLTNENVIPEPQSQHTPSNENSIRQQSNDETNENSGTLTYSPYKEEESFPRVSVEDYYRRQSNHTKEQLEQSLEDFMNSPINFRSPTFTYVDTKEEIEEEVKEEVKEEVQESNVETNGASSETIQEEKKDPLTEENQEKDTDSKNKKKKSNVNQVSFFDEDLVIDTDEKDNDKKEDVKEEKKDPVTEENQEEKDNKDSNNAEEIKENDTSNNADNKTPTESLLKNIRKDLIISCTTKTITVSSGIQSNKIATISVNKSRYKNIDELSDEILSIVKDRLDDHANLVIKARKTANQRKKDFASSTPVNMVKDGEMSIDYNIKSQLIETVNSVDLI